VDPQQVLERLKQLTSSLSRGQLISLGAAFFVVVVLVVSTTMWTKSPSYTLLFSDMDADTAGQIITKLKTMKVAYQLDEGGRGIRVPASKVDELRIQLTSEGLPATGRIGFEIFDKTQFGATEFLEQVNYRRALEGEIARTIATITEVASARVHIAMGKDSLFGESRPAKASVVLKLRNQRGLSESTINGISNLVAASVEGLRPEAVVILDSFGRPLMRPQDDPNDPLGAQQMERQARLEKEMSERVVALLEPVVGPDRVRVNVSMKLNPTSREETEEHWDPNAVLRSKQTSSDSSTNPQLGMVAGVRGNMPAPPDQKTPAQQPPPVPVAGSSRAQETSNYEISRTTRHIIQPPGDIARLSVAVIIDDDQVAKVDKSGGRSMARKPRTQQELQKMQALVAAAVGLETTRGDQLTVENISFDEPLVEDVPPPTMLEKLTPQIQEGSRLLLPIVVVLFALLFIVRPLVSRAGLKAQKAQVEAALVSTTAPGQPLKTVADLESEIEKQLDANLKDGDRKLPVLTKRVTTMSLNEPENIAKLLRTWMNEQER
jgi:flagellar M-ring protein FliF